MGQTIFVAFQYTSTNDEASTYEVDDIVVYGEPDNDYDDDGLTNDEEDALGTDPTAADSDGDGLTDYEEVGGDATYDEGLDTDPMNADSDGDGHSDGAEVDAGTDPLDENDAPSSAPAMDVWALLLLAGLLAVAFLALQRRPARTPARR
jgi:hypothetical protein